MTSAAQIDPRLSASARKRATYAEDTYFQEAHEQLAGSLGDVAGFARSHALLLLKPDAVRRAAADRDRVDRRTGLPDRGRGASGLIGTPSARSGTSSGTSPRPSAGGSPTCS